MWEQLANHGARFRVSDWMLKVEANEHGVTLAASCHHGISLSGQIQLPGLRLPAISESFVRGDELHLAMPQTDDECHVGVELALLVVEASPQQFVLESEISLQTQQLDLHPRVAMASGGSGRLSDRWTMSSLETARWYDPSQRDTSCPLHIAVLVDSRDRFSIDESEADRQSLGFFGDFMEKGVIRKVQPWWVWSCEEIALPARQQLARELACRPLPLAT